MDRFSYIDLVSLEENMLWILYARFQVKNKRKVYLKTVKGLV